MYLPFKSSWEDGSTKPQRLKRTIILSVDKQISLEQALNRERGGREREREREREMGADEWKLMTSSSGVRLRLWLVGPHVHQSSVTHCYDYRWLFLSSLITCWTDVVRWWRDRCRSRWTRITLARSLARWSFSIHSLTHSDTRRYQSWPWR